MRSNIYPQLSFHFLLPFQNPHCRQHHTPLVVFSSVLLVFPSTVLPLSAAPPAMRQEGSSLDLNNLPEEYAGGKQHQAAGVESSTTTAASSADTTRVKKKSSGGGGGKDADASKVYECRFCSLKFCKSQALGGHMNRHRQERETETLNRARQLVFGNETLSAVGAQMSFRDVNMGSTAPSTMLGGGGFRGSGVSGGAGGGVIGDQCLTFRPVHSRLSPQPQPPYHYLYTTTPSMAVHHPMSYPATYPTAPRQSSAAVGDYVIGHAVSSGDALMQQQQQPRRGGFSCFGAPLTAPAPATANVQPDNVNCNCSFGCSHNRNVNASS